MKREDRLSRLVDYIVANGSARVEQIADAFGVSPATVRRDLDSLAHQQLVTRTRGGAMVNSTSGDLPLRYRSVRQWREKNAIGAAVAAMVTPGEVIAFNGGTTTTVAAYEVGVASTAQDRFRDTITTVVTNAVNIANDLIVRPNLRIMVTGGVARARSYELVGPLASVMLPEISVDTLFLGVSALDPQRGLFTHHEGEAAINAALIELARRTYVLADSRKFTETAFARICGLDDVQGVITDSGADSEVVAVLRDRGLDVVIGPDAA